MKVSFFVDGIPQPGGSKKYVGHSKAGRPILIDDCKRNKTWRQRVAAAARASWPYAPTISPLFVRYQFIVLRPGCHYGRGRNATKLKKSAPVYPSVKPDVGKFWRSTEDAMTGVIWKDDASTIVTYAEKRYGDRPGCAITIESLPNVEPGSADVLFEDYDEAL